MNSIFNLNRFALLLRRRFVLNSLDLLVTSAVTFLVGIAIINFGLWVSWVDGSLHPEIIDRAFRELRNSVFIGTVVISGSIFASSVFAELGETNSGINYLMTPATHFEKWLVAFLTSTVVFLVGTTGLFFIAQSFVIPLTKALYGLQISGGELFTLFEPHLWAVVMKNFLLVHGLFMLGSVAFRAGHWWSSALAGLVLAAVYGGLTFGIGELIRPDEAHFEFQAGQWFASVEKDGIYSLPISLFWGKLTDALLVIFAPLCWFLAYLKLTEKQI